MPKPEIARRIDSTTRMLGIAPLLDRTPHQLSGGQQQRVAVGRAIVREPALFLMDEPLSNLDTQVRATTRAELKELQRRVGVTTLYVTHDQVEAMTLADRLAVMQHGRFEQIGPPLEVYRRPATLFVAQFLSAPRASTSWRATSSRVRSARRSACSRRRARARRPASVSASAPSGRGSPSSRSKARRVVAEAFAEAVGRVWLDARASRADLFDEQGRRLPG